MGTAEIITAVVLALILVLLFARRATAAKVSTAFGSVPREFESNARQLETEILQPIFEWGRRNGVQIIITSGYRDPVKNRLVGGVQNSCHMSGSAVDLVTGPKDRLSDLFDFVKNSLRFGELFLEKNADGSLSHVHVSRFPCGGQYESGTINV